MGWASAGQIFDPVAKALVELNAPDDMKVRVLGDLIGALQAGDWDTEDESLEQFADDPAIVQAFREHDVVLICGEQGQVQGVWTFCEQERGAEHGSAHHDESGREWS